MLALLALAVVLGFPACAVRAWRGGGGGRLWAATALALAAVAAAALGLASGALGNRLAPSYGYGHTASRMLLFCALTGGVPLVAAALAVRAAGPRWAPASVYVLAVGAALAGLVLGVVVAMYLLPMLA